MKEVWKDIAGFEGLYQVSNLGNVRSLDRTEFLTNQHNQYGRKRKGGVVKQFHDKRGYMVVTFSKGCKLKQLKVHRLVAMAFLPNLCNHPQVNHKDENKENNRVDNLEWCTNIYNANYGTRNERMSESMKETIKLKKTGL